MAIERADKIAEDMLKSIERMKQTNEATRAKRETVDISEQETPPRGVAIIPTNPPSKG